MPPAEADKLTTTRSDGEDEGNASGSGVPGYEGTLSAGSKFGRYQVVRLIGSGGMGAVYEATHTDLKKRVALKVLHPTYAHNEEIQTRFLREGEAASRVRHPHVVDMTDFGVHEGTPFLVMEYLEGDALSSRLKRDGKVPVTEVVDIMLPVCAAVGAAHDENVIHRDLKPENIFLSRTRRGDIQPKVVDFGVCKLNDGGVANTLTATNSLIGSPAYMSPEQIRSNKNVSPSVDQYALGIIMYECVTGRKPFAAETLFEIMGLIVQGQCPPPSELCPELPKELEAVILRAMHKDAAERFPSVHALGAALVPFASPRAQTLWAQTFGVTDIAPAPSASEMPPEPARSIPPPPAAAPVITVPAASASTESLSGETADREAVTKPVPKKAPPEPRDAARPAGSRNLVIGLVVAVVIAVGVLALSSARGASHPSPSTAPAPTASPAR